MLILDTNVLSELMKVRPEPRVLTWVNLQAPLELFTTSTAYCPLNWYTFSILNLLKGERRLMALSLDLRERIVSLYESGTTSIRKLAERFQVSKTTVHTLIILKRETGHLAPKPARGGKPSPLVGKEAEAIAMVAEHPDYTLSEYCELWQERTGIAIAESTMCRFLQRLKLTRKKNKTERQVTVRGGSAAARGVLVTHQSCPG